MMIKVSIGENLGKVKEKTIEWSRFTEVMSQHKQAEKKGGKYFVGGYFQSENRLTDQMVARTMITLDIDDSGMSIDELELHLMLRIECAFVAYSTFQHTPEHPRVRVVIPLSKEVTPTQYNVIARHFGENLDIPLDKASYTANAAMYLPTAPDLDHVWSAVQDGDPYDVDRALTLSVISKDDNEPDDILESLTLAVTNQPLDLTDAEVDGYLLAGSAQGLDYDQWLMRGAALHHQYQGGVKGFKKWLAWSEKSDKHDPRDMRKKYQSFGRSTRPTTMASVIAAVRDVGGLNNDAVEGVSETFDALLSEAGEVSDMAQYNAYKQKIKAMSETILADDKRAMIASALTTAVGKSFGLSKTDIKKAIKPEKHKPKSEGAKNAPEWVKPWVYVEKTMEFVNIDTHDYAIKREAFNAKYDRETECMISETSASNLALNVYQIPTVVDRMYFAGAEKIFDYHGKPMLNAYRNMGIEPCDTLDDDGQKVIDIMLEHVALTLQDEREQGILLDWIAHAYQNPSSRINWAILLQGGQGIGKSYFVNMMQHVMGNNVSNLDPSAINGRFTAWAYGSRIVAVEEIRISGTNRYETLDRMKPFLTNDTVQIEEKGRDHRTVPNFTNYFLLTNHKDAIPITNGDRRYCVLFSHIQSEAQLYRVMGSKDEAEAYFTRLFSETERRADAIAYYFANRKPSDEFKAKGRAPETKAREMMMQISTSPDRDTLEDAIEKHQSGVINDRIIDITQLSKMVLLDGDEMPKTRTLNAILLEMGYSQVDKKRVKIAQTGDKHRIWYKADVIDQDHAIDLVRAFYSDDDVPF